MKTIQGIPASNGIAIGPSFNFEQANLLFETKPCQEPEAELTRLQTAIAEAKSQIEQIHARAAASVAKEEAEIFLAHLDILMDVELIAMAERGIREQKVNAEAAWQQAYEHFAQQIAALDDEYFKARAADTRDVGQRVLRLLLGRAEQDLSTLKQPSVITARDLTPSDTIRLDKNLVLGFCTQMGGPTSHTAILAKSLGLPAVVGAGKQAVAAPGTTLIVNGSSGEVILEPDETTLAKYRLQFEAEEVVRKTELEQAHQPATTRDGHTVEIVANIGNAKDARMAVAYGAEGVGLFRTEVLYLERSSAPTENEQAELYREVLEVMGTRPVVVRTLDIGGDKEVPYLGFDKEDNPFLGWRAIRICLDLPDLFQAQLRALLRASPGHDLRIMFPMIATVEEVRRAKQQVEAARQALDREGVPYAPNIQVGIMVEIPSVVVMVEQFNPEVDFFSIGTNDLTQYSMAAERTNNRVAYLGDACHPAILRQIGQVIRVAHQAGRWVGVCGELAGDPDALPVLLGLGLDEFSMAASSIPHAKAVIRQWRLTEAQSAAAIALSLENGGAVRQYIREQTSNRNDTK